MSSDSSSSCCSSPREIPTPNVGLSHTFLGEGDTIYIFWVPINVYRIDRSLTEKLYLVQVGRSRARALQNQLFAHRVAWHYASGSAILSFVDHSSREQENQLFRCGRFERHQEDYAELVGCVSCDSPFDSRSLSGVCGLLSNPHVASIRSEPERLVQSLVGTPAPQAALLGLLDRPWARGHLKASSVYREGGPQNFGVEDGALRLVGSSELRALKQYFVERWLQRERVSLPEFLYFLSSFSRRLTPQVPVILSCKFCNRRPVDPTIPPADAERDDESARQLCRKTAEEVCQVVVSSIWSAPQFPPANSRSSALTRCHTALYCTLHSLTECLPSLSIEYNVKV